MHFTGLIAFASTAAALGINCRGSGLCGFAQVSIKDAKDAVDSLGDSSRVYADGEQIACVDGDAFLCVFFQGATGTAAFASSKIQDLIDHGCDGCGSCPTQPGNDVSTGELTINGVAGPCCTPAGNSPTIWCTC